MSSAVLIRPFRYPDEFPALFQLWQEAGDGVRVGMSDTPDEIEKKLQRDPELFLVAELNGRLVGSVIGGYDGRRGLIYHLAVDAAYRGQGIGDELMREVEARLRALGCLKAYLLVTLGNESAQAFYEKRGWGEMDLHLYGKKLEE